MFATLWRIPLRSWAFAAATYAVAVGALAPVTRWMMQRAVLAAGETSLSFATVPQLVRTPASWLFATAALLLVTVATAGWTAAVLAVALSAFDDARGVRAVARRMRAVLGSWVRRGWVVLTVPLALVPPLTGMTVFSPATQGLSLPPFIRREFLKSPLTGTVWVLAILSLASVAFAIVLILARFSDDRPGSEAASRLRLPSTARLWRLAAITMAIGWLAGGLGEDPGIVRHAIAVVAALTTAVVLVGHLRVATGTAAEAARAHRPGRRIMATAAVGLGLVGSVAAASAAPASPTWTDPPLVIAHRGFDRGGPENTILGLEAAARQGADVVEVDVQLTADGGIVAAHDTNLTVLAGTDRNIFEMTTAEVTRTTVRMHGHSDPIPTMTAYVQRARELGMPLLIELKVTGHETVDLVSAVLTELESIGGLEGNRFHSLDPDIVEQLERERPDLDTGLTLAMISGALPHVQCDFFVVEEASVTAAMVSAAHDRGAPIYAWTVNDDDVIRELTDLGVDGIVTDHVDSPVFDAESATSRSAAARVLQAQ